jgi:hypothetical protein
MPAPTISLPPSVRFPPLRELPLREQLPALCNTSAIASFMADKAPAASALLQLVIEGPAPTYVPWYPSDDRALTAVKKAFRDYEDAIKPKDTLQIELTSLTSKNILGDSFRLELRSGALPTKNEPQPSRPPISLVRNLLPMITLALYGRAREQHVLAPSDDSTLAGVRQGALKASFTLGTSELKIDRAFRLNASRENKQTVSATFGSETTPMKGVRAVGQTIASKFLPKEKFLVLHDIQTRAHSSAQVLELVKCLPTGFPHAALIALETSLAQAQRDTDPANTATTLGLLQLRQMLPLFQHDTLRNTLPQWLSVQVCDVIDLLLGPKCARVLIRTTPTGRLSTKLHDTVGDNFYKIHDSPPEQQAAAMLALHTVALALSPTRMSFAIVRRSDMTNDFPMGALSKYLDIHAPDTSLVL